MVARLRMIGDKVEVQQEPKVKRDSRSDFDNLQCIERSPNLVCVSSSRRAEKNAFSFRFVCGDIHADARRQSNEVK